MKAIVKDKRGWGSTSGSYTVVEGYKSITTTTNIPPDPTQWRFIWAFPSLPKIDFFCWTLAHNNILTKDNLRKCGMEGPSRCPLCLSEEESAIHLMLLCPFAREVWRGVLRSGAMELPGNIPFLLHNWAKLSPFNLTKKYLLKTAWIWIPKFTCWKLWWERNNRLFKDEKCNTSKIIIKIQALLGETLDTKHGLRNEAAMDNAEEIWLKDLVPNYDSETIPPALPQANWEIHLEEQEFIKWRSALGEHYLFFDGASKGNLRAVGGGGVILNPDGSTEIRFH